MPPSPVAETRVREEADLDVSRLYDGWERQPWRPGARAWRDDFSDLVEAPPRTEVRRGEDE